MFCNSCGGLLQPDYRVCPKCGSPIQGAVSGPPTYPPSRQGRVMRHIQPLAILWIIVGAFWLIPAVVMTVLGTVASIFIPICDSIGRTLGPAVMHLMGFGFLFVAAGAFLAGGGLVRKRA